MFGLLVGRCGLDVNYVLYEIDYDHAAAITNAITEADRQSWEQTRLQCYYSAAPFMKNKGSLHTFMPFDWDKKHKKSKDLFKKEELDKLLPGIMKAMEIYNKQKSKKNGR